MDEQPFDAFASAFAQGRLSRRRVLATAVLGAVGVTLPSWTGARSTANAQTGLVCQSSNTFMLPCEQLGAYGGQCGVLCPNGTRKQFASGCTVANLNQSNRTQTGFREYEEGKLTCAEIRVSWHWTANPQSSSWTWQPEAGRCCPKGCEKEAVDFVTRIAQHEQGHRDNINSVVNDVNVVWHMRFFKECRKNSLAAEIALLESVGVAVVQTESAAGARIREEPPQAAPPNCNPCSAAEGRLCCGNVCVDPAAPSGSPASLAAASNVCGDTCCGPDQICCNDTCQSSTAPCCPPGQHFCDSPITMTCIPDNYVCCHNSLGLGYCTTDVTPGEGVGICCPKALPSGCASEVFCAKL
jgi:hypothetical protein